MTPTTAQRWETKRTQETRQVEHALRDAGFERVDAYRFNSASIRLRVIDSRFEQLSAEKRDALIEPYLESLPERTQADIVNLLTLAPSELQPGRTTFGEYLNNAEFEDPRPSML